MDEIRITRDELNNLSKDAIVTMYLQLTDSFHVLLSQTEKIQQQNDQLLKQVSSLQESVAVLTQQRFGRSTEKTAEIEGQLSFDLSDMLILNKAEELSKEGAPAEPEMEEVIVHRKKRTKGKRDADLEGLESVDEWHYLSEEELASRFPDGYRQLPDEVYRDLEFIPSKFLVHVHHVGVYAGKDTIIRADRPYRLIQNSILTPALGAAVFNAKYVNAVPLNRLSEEFLRNGASISRQVMAHWMINLSSGYLEPLYHEMHREILKSRLIHCDETPFKLIHDGRGPGSKNYMWVYHTADRYGAPPIFLYEYQPGRKAAYPEEFLRGYRGVLMTDGYQVYHKLADEHPEELRVAGCWAHAKRRFATLVKSLAASNPNALTAAEANKRIAAIYHVDNMYKDASDRERLHNRRSLVKPLVDAYFAWVKGILEEPVDKGSELYKALSYSVNQEPYLRAFLDDPMIPLDNNDAERSIRAFCVGKHSWHVVDSINGAKASGILYSIAETAKANSLKPYEYFRHVLEESCRRRAKGEKTEEYIRELLPWSESIPDHCKKEIK